MQSRNVDTNRSLRAGAGELDGYVGIKQVQEKLFSEPLPLVQLHPSYIITHREDDERDTQYGLAAHRGKVGVKLNQVSSF